jgi:hypothetical protein
VLSPCRQPNNSQLPANPDMKSFHIIIAITSACCHLPMCIRVFARSCVLTTGWFTVIVSLCGFIPSLRVNSDDGFIWFYAFTYAGLHTKDWMLAWDNQIWLYCKQIFMPALRTTKYLDILFTYILHTWHDISFTQLALNDTKRSCQREYVSVNSVILHGLTAWAHCMGSLHGLTAWAHCMGSLHGLTA